MAYPRSFLGLLLTGFTVVALPLVGALAYSAWNTERLAEQSRTAVFSASQAAPAPRSAQDRRHRGRIGRERVRGPGHQLPGGRPRGGAAAIERRGGAAQADPARHLQHRRRAHHSARPHALHLAPDRGARRVDPATRRGGFLARDHRARPGGSAIARRAARLAAATARRAGGGEKPLSAPSVARAEDASYRAA